MKSSSATSPPREVRGFPPPPLMTARELGAYLRCSSAQISRLMAEGMPFTDLSVPRLGHRPKRTARFDLRAVTEWMEARRRSA